MLRALPQDRKRPGHHGPRCAAADRVPRESTRHGEAVVGIRRARGPGGVPGPPLPVEFDREATGGARWQAGQGGGAPGLTGVTAVGMSTVSAVLLLSGLIPLGWGLRANR